MTPLAKPAFGLLTDQAHRLDDGKGGGVAVGMGMGGVTEWQQQQL